MNNPTQAELEAFVHNNVITCQSSLVEMLYSKDIFSYDDISNMYAYICPECGHGEQDIEDFQHDTESDDSYMCPSCKKSFIDEPENEMQEILEWWVVDSRLLNRLEEHGECVLHTDYGDWWGRCTSGQAISMDSVIENIYKEIQ